MPIYRLNVESNLLNRNALFSDIWALESELGQISVFDEYEHYQRQAEYGGDDVPADRRPVRPYRRQRRN